MKWQDIVIAVCQLSFIPAMIPSVVSKDKPALLTSGLNVVIVTIIASCLFSLRLWFAGATAVPIAIIWLILAIQKYKMSH